MQEIIDYYLLNWEICTPLILLFIEVLLRRIPTFSNISLVGNFNALLDFFCTNKAKITDRAGKHSLGKFISTYDRLRDKIKDK